MTARDWRDWFRTSAPWSGPYAVLSVCAGSYFAVRFAQVVVGPVVPRLVETFAVSRGELGAALTGMWVVYALSQLPSGAFADRFGERAVVLAALALTACATLALASARTFPVFGLGVLGLGVGAGVYYNPATTLLTREFDGVGRAIGAHRIGGQVAGVVAPLVAASVGVRYGWRAAVAIGAALTVVAGAAFLRTTSPTAPARPTASLDDLFELRPIADLLARGHTQYTAFLGMVVEFVGMATMAFLPIFLVEHRGFPEAWASVAFAVFFGFSAVLQPLGGWLSDRIGRDRTLAVQLTLGVAGYALLAAPVARPLAVPAVVFAGAAMTSTPVIQSRMLDGLSAGERGTGFGVFRTVYLLVGALGTTVVGTTADLAGWAVAFGLQAALLGVALVALVATLARPQ